MYLDPDILDTLVAIGRDLSQPLLARALPLCSNEGVDLLLLGVGDGPLILTVKQERQGALLGAAEELSALIVVLVPDGPDVEKVVEIDYIMSSNRTNPYCLK